MAGISASGVQSIGVYVRRKTKGSPARARTWDLAVNSRSLYLLSYRGMSGERITKALANLTRSGGPWEGLPRAPHQVANLYPQRLVHVICLVEINQGGSNLEQTSLEKPNPIDGE